MGNNRLNQACIKGPFEASTKYGRPTETANSKKSCRMGVSAPILGFHAADGVMGDGQNKPNASTTSVVTPNNAAWTFPWRSARIWPISQ